MKKVRHAAVAAAVLISASSLSVGTAEASRSIPIRPVPVKLFNHIPPGIAKLVQRILAEECQIFPFLCHIVVPPPVTTTTTTTVPTTTTTTVVPPTTTTTTTTSTTSSTTTTTVAPTTTTTMMPVPYTLPSMPPVTSFCHVVVMGNGAAQCFQFTSVSSSS